MWEMTVDDLIGMLENFDGSSEVAIEVDFPGIDGWQVKTYSFGVRPDNDSDGPKLGFSIYESAFDYPDILRVLKGRRGSNTRGVLHTKVSPEKRPHPPGKKPIPIQAIPCIEDYDDQTVYINRIDKVSTGTYEYMNRVYDKLGEINALDTFEYLEISSLFLDDQGFSHTQIGGVPVYHDRGHINTLYSASAGEFFTEQLSAIIDE
jgi:hypothetical protein